MLWYLLGGIVMMPFLPAAADGLRIAPAWGRDLIGFVLALIGLYALPLGYLCYAKRRAAVPWGELMGRWRGWPHDGRYALAGLVTLSTSIAMSTIAAMLLASWWPDWVERYLLNQYWKASQPSALAVGLSVLLLVVVAPVCEELFFRGYLLRRWSTRWGLRRAVLFSSFLFGLLHAQNFLWITCLGVAMALLTLHAQNLWVPILAHATNNALVLVVGRLFNDGSSTRATVEQLYQQAWLLQPFGTIAVAGWGWFILRHWRAAERRSLWPVDGRSSVVDIQQPAALAAAHS